MKKYRNILAITLAAVLLAVSPAAVYAEDGDQVEVPESGDSEVSVPSLDTSKLEVPTIERTQLNAEGMDISQDSAGMSESFSDFRARLGSETNPLSAEDIDLGLNTAYGKVLSSIGGNEKVNLSDAMSEAFGFSLQKNLSTDLTDLSALNLSEKFDQGYLDMQYTALSDAMEKGINVNMDDLKGSSMNAVDLFNNTYGDLYDSLSLMDNSIPEEFDPAKMIKNSKSMIDSTYSKAISTGSFADIKNSISIGGIFSKAAAGVSAPGLASAGELRGMLSSISAGNKSAIDSEYRSYVGDVGSHYGNFNISSAANDLWIVNGGDKGLNVIGTQSKKYEDIANSLKPDTFFFDNTNFKTNDKALNHRTLGLTPGGRNTDKYTPKADGSENKNHRQRGLSQKEQ